MEDLREYISRLEEKITRLQSELKEEKRIRKDLDDTRRAMLNLLEDLQETSEMIERAKKEWEDTFDAITDPIFIHDRDLRIVRANKAYREAVSLPYSNIIGRPYYEIFPKIGRPLETCQRAIEEEGGEEEISLPTGRIFIVRFYPVRDPQGRYLYSIHVFEDVTELRETEKALRQEVETTRHLLSIAEVTAHTTDIDAMMKEVARCTRRIIGCKVCLSYIWEEDLFKPVYPSGLSHWFLSLFRTTTIDGETLVKLGAKGSKPSFINRALWNNDKELEETYPWLKGANTLVVIPLYVRYKKLGLLIGIYEEEKTFSKRDERLMEGISHQVSMALEEARLYKDLIVRTMELSHTIETMKVMHEIDRGILSTLEPREIVETSTRMIVRLIPCHMAAIALLDEGRGWITYISGFAEGLAIRDAIVPLKDTSATEVLETGRTQYLPDLRAMECLHPFETRLLREGFLCHVRLPITVRRKRVGIFHMASKNPSAFTPEDLHTLERVVTQIAVALENARLLTDLKELLTETITALARAIDAKSPWTKGHSERVSRYAIAIAREMGLSEEEIEDLRIAGLLHDIGKIGTYDVLLDKPGGLTKEEYEVVKKHPEKGAELLYPIRQLRHIVSWIKHHHERWDGKGYPDGLKDEEIPLQARILAVADTFDSMTSERPYRKTPGKEEALKELKRCSGTQFDPEVVEAFLRALPEIYRIP